MKYIDLYKNQLEQNSHDNDLYESQYYLEYCKLNCFLNDFQRSHTYIKDLIIGDIDLLSKMETDRINQSISLLKKQMTKLPKAFQEILDSIELSGIIFMIGDGTVDSHGILIDHNSYLLIDILAYSKHLEKYNPVSFLVHELSHCMHYYFRPEMYFANYQHKIEKVIKRLLVEGIASYITKETTDECDADIFWLGYLDKNEVDQWIDYALSLKEHMGLEIKRYLDKDEWKEETQNSLFSLVDPDHLWKGRLAYFYGYELAKQYSENKTINQLLMANYDSFKDLVSGYFTIPL